MLEKVGAWQRIERAYAPWQRLRAPEPTNVDSVRRPTFYHGNGTFGASTVRSPDGAERGGGAEKKREKKRI